MVILYFLNNNPLLEAFVELFLLSVFLHGAHFLVCLVIFFTVSCSSFMETYLWDFFVACYKDAFIQREFAVASTQLPEAAASPRPL